jgi:hypothetical protein
MCPRLYTVMLSKMGGNVHSEKRILSRSCEDNHRETEKKDVPPCRAMQILFANAKFIPLGKSNG